MKTSRKVLTVRQVPSLIIRRRDAHKGDFGRVLIVGGCVGMAGAPSLAGMAALRAGAGLVTVAVPEPIQPVVAGLVPCATTLPLPATADGRINPVAARRLLLGNGPATRRRAAVRFEAIAIGPGVGLGPPAYARAFWGLLRELRDRHRAGMVIDADALNLSVLSARPAVHAWNHGPHRRTIFTPHPGELARMLGQTTTAIQGNRRSAVFKATLLMEGNDALPPEDSPVFVLKGADTLVTDGRRVYTNTTGNPGMATGGSGDVLTGLLAGLLAQGYPTFEAAVLGVYLHGLAGDLAAEETGEEPLIASDLIDGMILAFRKHGGGTRRAR